MLYESVILKAVFTLLNRLREAYCSSFAAKCFKKIADWFKWLVSTSSIWGFIKRKDYFSKVWENSWIFRFTDFIFNFPSKIFRRLYGRIEDLFMGSMAFKLLKTAFSKFEAIISLFLLIALIVPHQLWNNAYSTVFVFLIAVLFFMKTIIQRYERFNVKAIDFALFIFIFSVVLAEFTSIFPKESLRFLLFYLTCFLLVLVIVSAVKTIHALDLLLKIMLFGVFLTGLYGIRQAIAGVPVDPSLTDVTLNEGMGGRIYSTMGNPNNYAEILIMTLPFFAALIFNSKSTIKKIYLAVLAVPPLIALFLTGARSSWISFAVAILIFVFLKNRKLLPLALVAGLLCIPLLPDWILRRMMTIFNPNDKSASYRVLIYDTVMPMFKDFWPSGLGLGTEPFMRIVQRYPMFTKQTPPHSHNMYLQIWLEVGLVGILSFIWFIARLIKKCMLNICNKTDEGINNILIAGVSSISAIGIMSLAEYPWFYPRVMLFFWAVVGIILAGLSILASREERLAINNVD